MTGVLQGAVVLLTALYPLVVHTMMDRLPPAWLATPFAVLWLWRGLARPSDMGGRALPVVACVCCVVMAVANSVSWLKAYPVMINATLCAMFVASLRSGMPVIERLARMRGRSLPEAGVRYTRRLTVVWSGFFAANAGIALGLAVWAPFDIWALYCGVIAYVAAGLLLVGEWAVRPTSARAV